MKVNDRKITIKQGKFIDKTLGKELEYIKIDTGKGFIIIFGTGDQIVVKYFENVKEIVEKYIEQYFENKFLNDRMEEQETQISKLVIEKAKKKQI